MQRNVAHVVEQRDFPGLGENLVALLFVRLLQGLARQRVDLRIAIVADIVAAPVGLRVAAAHDVLEDVEALERRWRPAQEIERRIEAARRRDGCEEFRFRLGVEVDLDPDAREHADHRLADLLVVDIAVVRAIHLHFEAVRIAGLGEQFLRGGGVEGKAMEVLRQRKQRRRDHERARRRLSAHHLLGDRILVDRLIERLADANVLERILALDAGMAEFVAGLVHAEKNGADLRSGQNLGPRIGVDPRLVVERHRIDPVDFARQQRRNTGRGVGDRGEDHLVDIGLRLVPPVRVALPDGLHARLVADEDERSGPVGVQAGIGRGRRIHRGRLGRAMRLRPALREDAPGLPFVNQKRIGPLQQEVDGVVVDLHDLGVRGDAALEVGAGAAHALGGENDVVGGEVLAFVELDALAQMKAPMQRDRGLPSLWRGRARASCRGRAGRALHTRRR